METKTVERNWGLDLLRILAAFTVVMLHVSPQAYLDVDIASAPWNVMNAITGLCCWNVSAFFMLSGAFLLAPQKAISTRTLYRKNIARLAAAFVFWSAYAGYVLTKNTKAGLFYHFGGKASGGRQKYTPDPKDT